MKVITLGCLGPSLLALVFVVSIASNEGTTSWTWAKKKNASSKINNVSEWYPMKSSGNHPLMQLKTTLDRCLIV